MTHFAVTVEVDAPVERAWSALVDWPSHSAWIPLTTVRLISARPDGVGAAFVARTGVGRLAFDDPMVVTRWEPPRGRLPGRCTVRKTGTRVLGWASFEVEPVGPGGRRSRVRWQEDVGIPPVALTRPLGPLVAVGARLAFAAALRRYARRVERGA